MNLTRLLHLLPPELAHNLAVQALKRGFVPKAEAVTATPMLATEVSGVKLPNPIGMAAGFDKNAEAVSGLLQQGFGFTEAGTVTPRPQSGNPKPRLFRLAKDEAVINRMGFNNKGIEAFLANLKQHNLSAISGAIGLNIGKNKDTIEALDDYSQLLQRVYGKSDYITINISSPNTPGLRDLQKKQALHDLLAPLMDLRSTLHGQHKRYIPIWLKIAPDITAEEMGNIVDVALDTSIDALIISNTTIHRPVSLRSYRQTELGGLSGKPLFAPSTELLRDTYRYAGGRLPLIGVGGITSVDDAYAKIRAGASAVQLYTALIYHGLALVKEIIEGLNTRLEADGFTHISEAIGIDC